METVQKLVRFLDESPTCYHAAANVKAALNAAGAVELRESKPWKLEKGTLYVVERGDSAVIAFRVPEKRFHGFLLAAAHSDSPTFKIRERAEVPSAGNTLRLSVEPYGGGIWRGWLDRPLSVAGRVVIRQGNRLLSRLVNIDRDLLVIPSVAIHMDRTVNKGTELNPAADLLPLLGCGREPGAFRRLIAEAAGVREEHLLSTELFLYPRTRAVQTGLQGEFIVSPRLDDLQCVFGCLEGFLAAQPGENLPVLAVFNNEEEGGGGQQLSGVGRQCPCYPSGPSGVCGQGGVPGAERRHRHQIQRQSALYHRCGVRRGVSGRLSGGGRPDPAVQQPGGPAGRLHSGQYLHGPSVGADGGYRPAPAGHAQRLRDGRRGGYGLPCQSHSVVLRLFIPTGSGRRHHAVRRDYEVTVQAAIFQLVRQL